MPTTIESLELQVQSSSTSAVKGIDALSASLSKLKNATKGGVGLNSVANQVRNLDTALKSVDGSSADKIDKLSNSLSKLKGLGSIKISSSIGNQLKNISTAASALKGADLSGINKLSAAIQPLSSIGKASGLQSAITQLQKLPQLAQTLNSVNWATLTSQLQQLSNALAPLANQLNTVSTAFTRLPTNIRSVVSATKSITTANNEATNSYINLWAKARMAYNAIRTGAHVIASWITQSNQYIENLNLFTASMGQYAAEAQKYAEQVGELMGIDPGQFMRYQGVFNTIIAGFGVANDQAYLMSKNLTQLGYDLASFFNISFEDAMLKLQSGISGELEPLRRLGYDLSVARLQQEALNLGIEKSVMNMTQAEKSQLRYYAIMTQVTVAQGDMARTLNAPANQLRVLQAQVTQCARALGNIFIPVLNAVLPYAIALAKVIRLLASAIASFFGFELPEVDYSGISAGSAAVGDLADNAGNAASGLGDAAKAAKKLKNATLGIDELNILSPNDSSSAGGGAGGGGGIGGGGAGDLGIDLPTYDFLGELVSTKVDEIVNLIMGALNEITAVVSGFLLAIGTILVVTGANVPLGLGLMAVGAVGLASVVIENWDYMSERLAKTLTTVTSILAGFLLAIGAFLAFSGVNVPLGAGLMVAGAVALGTAVAINWKFLNGDLKNALSILTGIVSGALLAMGALFAFTGVDAPLGIALMVAGAVGLATSIGLNWDSMSDPLRRTIGLLEGIVGGALLALGAILAFTGANIPLGVGMIAAGAISLVSAVALNWNSLSGGVQDSINSIVAIISGAALGIGAVLALSGVATGLGVALLAAGAAGLATTVGLNWNSMTDEVRSTVTKILVIVGAAALAISVEAGVELVKKGWSTVKGWIGKIPGVSQAVSLAKSGWETVKGWIGNIPSVSQMVSLAKSGWTTIKNWIGNIPVLSQGISLLKSGWTTVKNWIGNIPTLSQAISLIKSGWTTVKNWIGNIPTLSQAISLVKSGWTTIKNWIGNIPVLSQGIKLLKSGWTTVKSWIGNIPVISQGISLIKSGWTSIKNWIGSHVVSVGISLFKSGWSSLSSWIGDKVSVGVSLFKSGWSSLKKFFGLSDGGYNSGHGWKFFERGGFIDNGQAQFWKNIPMYANGTTNAGLHGSMFVAGENGAEMVGHINGQTEVLNRSQIAMAMKNAVVSGMSQFTGYWRSMYSQMTVCSNAIIRSILVSSDMMNASLATAGAGYDPTNTLASSVYEDSQRGINNSFSDESFSRAMREFYQEYVEPTLREIADDTKRQADKNEQTIVQVGNRTVNDAVVTQQKANGYSFVK